MLSLCSLGFVGVAFIINFILKHRNRQPRFVQTNPPLTIPLNIFPNEIAPEAKQSDSKWTNLILASVVRKRDSRGWHCPLCHSFQQLLVQYWWVSSGEIQPGDGTGDTEEVKGTKSEWWLQIPGSQLHFTEHSFILCDWRGCLRHRQSYKNRAPFHL